MPNIDNIKKYKNIHMIGIGGVSMSGIAAILKNFGFHVTGSDWVESETTNKLNNLGIHVTIGHSLDDVAKSDAVVYSAAIKQDDPEMLEAKRLHIPTIERADFLGELTRCYQDTICISGTHGKTTTTSMISLCFLEGLQDPSIQVGAFLKQINGNYKVGSSEHFIIEACEYVESFLKFSPKAEIILNIDNDHLDYFKTFDNIKNAFIKYTKLLPDNGLLIINGDDSNCLELPNYTKAKAITYGIKNENVNFSAKNISFNEDGFAKFDLYHNNNFLDTIELSVPGTHNVLNALACISLSIEYGISISDIKVALSKFTGAHRRFEYKGKIDKKASVYDDYGHHPTEIKATGAGFPGMPMGILEPTAQLTLLDSLGKRIDFLQETAQALHLQNIPCVHARAEEFAGQHREGFDLAVSRAVAALPMLCELAMPLVKTEGLFLAMKSVESDGEIESARGAIGQLGGKIEKILDYTVPCTEVRHRVVVIRKVRPTPSQFPRPFAKIKKSPLK